MLHFGMSINYEIMVHCQKEFLEIPSIERRIVELNRNGKNLITKFNIDNVGRLSNTTLISL